MGIETNLDGLAGIVDWDHFLAFAGLRDRREDFHFFLGEPHADSSRAFVGKLSDTFNSLSEFIPAEGHRASGLFRKYPFVVREIAGELSAHQQPRADLEKQVIIVTRKLKSSISARIAR